MTRETITVSTHLFTTLCQKGLPQQPQQPQAQSKRKFSKKVQIASPCHECHPAMNLETLTVPTLISLQPSLKRGCHNSHSNHRLISKQQWRKVISLVTVYNFVKDQLIKITPNKSPIWSSGQRSSYLLMRSKVSIILHFLSRGSWQGGIHGRVKQENFF